MKWSPTMPTTPGRYFYRERKSGDYGICLVAWSRGFVHGSDVYQPKLGITASCHMGSETRNSMGENSEHPTWSYGREPVGEVMFCSEPLVTPNFPEISGRPPNVAAEVVKKEKARSAAQTKANKKRERERTKARKELVEDMVAAGSDLHECGGCGCYLFTEVIVTGKLRECPHCCVEFVESDEGRNCPDCNRPFTRLVEEKQTCPDCWSGGELPDLTLIVKDGYLLNGGRGVPQ